ncbi:methylated-DNA--[protein]-cysteine S-methyltransferase [Alteromonas sp. KUL49]|uniref:methylated-DNA--[protein]-cysteine S-methyltransferase n=1 Tax=Alteromonas sp. KUL49 TaxID=2480798 RepID=UPI00102EEE68|nr:methylated-DNA--[protein]-cysteine S-methyltransferase [Alteromonas sp. KUL49]TAP42303.1 methylated-DNA--[protein]-cysteine S-methyltransferase [Alteromonas sp. KUL49]GEA09909.1 methylated-DNA--protein-cysteine methyltransferase [Alteromonas sp. KUL49]
MEYNQLMPTPIGLLEVRANELGVTSIAFVEASVATLSNELTALACEQLKEYFDKQRTDFDFPLAANGTEFQRQVWDALVDVPYGETVSYAAIANAIDNPKAVRAVGAANGKNPIAIVVPCHRVIGSNNTLTGYAGGLDRKRFLLNLEGAQQGLWD